jgi:hypothetical protein
MRDDFFAELTKLASELSKRASQLDEIMQALHNINLSVGDRKKMQELINHMAKFNKSTTPSPVSQQTGASSSERKGDFFYDLFNSPAMLNIIKEHYSKKKNR